MNKVNVCVSATTANLGVGFDCIGAALSMYNEFQFSIANTGEKLKIVVEGKEADRVSTNESNLVYQSFLKLYQQIDREPPDIEIKIRLGVPLSRGLGSSATAIVGGLTGANQLAGNPLVEKEIGKMAIAIEGHPDNVVPALLGDCKLSVGAGDDWQISPIPWHQKVIPVVAIPDFELSTEEARSVLPTTYTRADAIFNISRMGLLIRGLATGDRKWLTMALEDKLHQPYRKKLIRGYDEVKSAAIAAGAYGMVISGAGPTLLALTNSQCVDDVIAGMSKAWLQLGVDADVRSLTLETLGTNIT